MKAKDIKTGDIVVWIGGYPAIGTVKGKCKHFDNSYIISDTHNSCDISGLRLPTTEELQMLSDSGKDFLRL